MPQKSFILHQDSLVILEKMTDEQAGKFIKILYYFKKTGELQELDFAMEMATTPFLNQFKRDGIKYNNVCEARKLAGSKGGKQKVANASKCKQKVANLAENDNDNDNDSDNKNKKEKPKGFRKPTFEEIKNYCEERKNGVDPKKFFDYYETGNWKDAKNNQVKNWKQKLITWENKIIDNPNTPKQNTNQPLCDFVNKIAKSTLITKIIVSGSNKAALYFDKKEDYYALKDLSQISRDEIKQKISSELGTNDLEFKY